jgi:hypothetical protein
LKTWKLPLRLHRHCVLRSLVMAMAVADLTEVAKKRTEKPVREGGGRGMATAKQVAQLDKLMQILKDDTKRGKFKSSPNPTADAEGVDRSVTGIQDTIDKLAAEWSVTELKKLADLNDKMFKDLKENPASTTMVLAKQV